MVKSAAPDLPVIQKTYDLIQWYIPILNRLPRDHRFTLGERMVNGLYDLLVDCGVSSHTITGAGGDGVTGCWNGIWIYAL